MLPRVGHDLRQELLSQLFQLHRTHAGDLRQALAGLRDVVGHLAQRPVAEDDVRRHVAFRGELPAQGAQDVEQRRVVGRVRLVGRGPAAPRVGRVGTGSGAPRSPRRLFDRLRPGEGQAFTVFEKLAARLGHAQRGVFAAVPVQQALGLQQPGDLLDVRVAQVGHDAVHAQVVVSQFADAFGVGTA